MSLTIKKIFLNWRVDQYLTFKYLLIAQRFHLEIKNVTYLLRVTLKVVYHNAVQLDTMGIPAHIILYVSNTVIVFDMRQ